MRHTSWVALFFVPGPTAARQCRVAEQPRRWWRLMVQAGLAELLASRRAKLAACTWLVNTKCLDEVGRLGDDSGLHARRAGRRARGAAVVVSLGKLQLCGPRSLAEAELLCTVRKCRRRRCLASGSTAGISRRDPGWTGMDVLSHAGAGFQHETAHP